MLSRPMRLFVTQMGGATLLLLLPMIGCGKDPAPTPMSPRPIEVEIVQVKTADIPVSSRFVGRTESSQRVEIRTRVSGFLSEIVYEEGGFVEAGDVLFKIDPAPFESQLRAAQAELEQQNARLSNAESLLARIEPLAEAEAVSQKELDEARGTFREAAAAVEVASARVFDAELNLGYATIVAPVDGLTGESDEREGAYVSGTSGSLTYVARIDPMWVEFSISETEILRVVRAESDGRVVYPQKDQVEVQIELVDGTVHPHAGRISFSDASISTETGTFLVRAEVPNPEETLRPGQFVRVMLLGAYRPDAVIVPQRAVREGPKGPYLWVIDRDGHAEQRPVRLGPWHHDAWIVETGIGEGDRVIVNGSVGLRPGAPVSVGRLLSDDDWGVDKTSESDRSSGKGSEQ